DLLFTLAGRDIKVRYKQTFLGVTWIILQPLMAAGVFSFVFGKVAKLPSDGIPYFIFSYAGLLGWNVFSNTLSKASNSMLGNSHLISKVYFPRLVLPLSGIFTTLLDFGVALVVMFFLMLIHHIPFAWPLLLLPIWVALTMLVALGIGLISAALTVRYRDIGHILPVATQLLMYGSPVAYAVSAVPASLHGAYFLNPLASLLECFRWSLLDTGTPDFRWLLYATGISFGTFIVGAFAFKRMEREFADVI